MKLVVWTCGAIFLAILLALVIAGLFWAIREFGRDIREEDHRD